MHVLWLVQIMAKHGLPVLMPPTTQVQETSFILTLLHIPSCTYPPAHTLLHMANGTLVLQYFFAIPTVPPYVVGHYSVRSTDNGAL